MKQETISLVGGTGFVGTHLAARLTEHGYRVRVLSRHPERHRSLAINPGTTLVRTDVHDPAQLEQQLAGSDVVINLAGILNQGRGSGFQRVHVDLPGKIVCAARAAGTRRLLHMSALNADAAQGASDYLRSKGEGEDLVHAAHDLVVTSFRPSVIFGPGDSLFNRFAGLLKIAGPVFPLACPDSRFAPVCVHDVTEAICRSLDIATGGERLELCGPEAFTLRQLVTYTRDLLGLRSYILGLNDGLSRLQAGMLGLLPGKPFSMDNYRSLQQDSLCSGNALPGLGIKPTPIAALVPAYLAGNSARGRYPAFRRRARHG